MDRVADKYRIDPRILKLLPQLAGLIIVLQFALTFPAFAAYKVYFWGENQVIEQLQFLFFFLASIQALALTWHMVKQREPWIVGLFYLLTAGAFFFIAMEEIAWGQQYLHFQSPEAIKAFNVQNEVTLHNVELLQDRTDILNLAFGLAGLIGIAVGTRPAFHKIGVPVYLSLWFGLIVILAGLGVFNDFVSVNRQFDYSIHKQTETVELLIAIAGFLFLFFNARAFNLSALRPVDIIAVGSSGPALRLELSDGRAIPLAVDQIPIERQAGWQINPDGQSMTEEAPAASIALADLLRPPPDPQRIAEQLQMLWNRWNFWIAEAAGLMVAIWLILIPSDPKNAWLAGLSPSRVLMIALALGISVGAGAAGGHFTRRPTQYQRLCTRLNKIILHPFGLFAASVLSAALILGSLIFLIFAFTNQDLYQRSILDRLAPWVALIGFLSLIALAQLVWRVPGLRRPSLHFARSLNLDDERIHIHTTVGLQIEVPLDSFPRLHAASAAQRSAYELIHNGLRVCWPEIGVDICVQQFFAGMPKLS